MSRETERSFEVATFSLTISKTLNNDSVKEIESVNINDIIQVFKSDSLINDMSFSFNQDNPQILHDIGVTKGERQPYWAYFSDGFNVKRFHTAEELFNAKIYDGQSLRERWPDVTIVHMNGLPIVECFSQFEKSIKIRVDETNEGLMINGVTLNGYVTKEKVCHVCVADAYYLKPYRGRFNDFQHLKICTDVDLRKAWYIDNLGVRRQDGNRWQVDDYDVGLAIHPQKVIKSGVTTNALGMPYLEGWDEEYQYKHIFSVIWKYYESDEDASLWFNV